MWVAARPLCRRLLRPVLTHAAASTVGRSTSCRISLRALTLSDAPPASLQVTGPSPPSRPRTDGLRAHAHILTAIVASGDPTSRRRTRVRGVVRKLEERHVEWIAEVSGTAHHSSPSLPAATVCAELLLALCEARPYLDSHRLERVCDRSGCAARGFVSGKEAELEWTGVSPFFSAELSDALCLCLRQAAHGAERTPAALHKLMNVAVTLELADTDALQMLVRGLTDRDSCATCTTAELVETLRLLSLAVKRCKLQPPPLDHVLCRLPSERRLSARDSLQVLSSLVRLRSIQSAMGVASVVSRNATQDVATYTVKDVVFGLEAVAIISACHETYAGAVLVRCAELAPTMTPKAVGDVCKYIALLSAHRLGNEVMTSCAPELRRVLPAIEQRAKELLGSFSLRDARYVLRCFTEHRVRHSILFPRLTPYANHGG